MEFTHYNLLKDKLLAVWPEHEKILNKGQTFCSEELNQFSNKMSEMILTLIKNEEETYCKSYKWTCEMLTQEEIHFRREDKYRFSKLSEVQEMVYDDEEFMTKYVQGLLLSQVFWTNHINTIYEYSQFLNDNNFESILEVGPGHGLLLALAGKKGISNIHGWDISSHSLEETKKSLTKILPNTEVKYKNIDVLQIKESDLKTKFDAIVLSEILEHVERPEDVLKSLKQIMKENTKLFINVPLNSPAPDHIYYLGSREDAINMVENAGLKIEQTKEYPLTGYSLEAAVKRKMAISVCMVVTL